MGTHPTNPTLVWAFWHREQMGQKRDPGSPKLRMIMEPKYYAFRRWFGYPWQYAWRPMAGNLGCNSLEQKLWLDFKGTNLYLRDQYKFHYKTPSVSLFLTNGHFDVVLFRPNFHGKTSCVKSKSYERSGRSTPWSLGMGDGHPTFNDGNPYNGAL